MAQLDRMMIGILAADGSEQVEITAPRTSLASHGATVRVLTPGGRDITGYHYMTPGDPVAADGDIESADAELLDALIIPGGLGGPDTLRKHPATTRLISNVVDSGTPIGVICHGPWLLMDADALSGRSLTCVPQLSTELALAGARYVDQETHVERTDGHLLVSGRDHDAAQQFADALVHELAMARR